MSITWILSELGINSSLSAIAPSKFEVAAPDILAATTKDSPVEENPFSGGWGSEIISYVTSKCYKELKAPPFRITAPDTHIPFNEKLEKKYLPSVEYIKNSINKYVETDEVPPSWWEKLGV